MSLSLQSIIATIREVGSATPAFKALFDQVVGVFGHADQAALKDAYAKARAKTDADHATLQDELAKASQK